MSNEGCLIFLSTILYQLYQKNKAIFKENAHKRLRHIKGALMKLKLSFFIEISPSLLHTCHKKLRIQTLFSLKLFMKSLHFLTTL